jgi:hypothetical protein
MEKINNLLMVIDGFHYDIILLIKRYDYTKEITLLSIEIKKKIDNLLNQFHDQYYGYQNLFLRLLCAFSDGLFNKYGQEDKKILWNYNSMEKTYCQTMTGAYGLLKNLENIINNHQWLPPHIIYSHWLFFNGLNYNLDNEMILYFHSQLNIEKNKVNINLNKAVNNSKLLKINFINFYFY